MPKRNTTFTLMRVNEKIPACVPGEDAYGEAADIAEERRGTRAARPVFSLLEGRGSV